MINKKYAAIGTGFLLVALLIFKACDNKKIKTITDTKLNKDEQVAIIVNPNTGEVTTVRRSRKDRKGTTQVERPIDGSRDIRIGVGPTGRVIVTARTKGFIFEPGFCAGEAEVLRVGLDAQFYFYHRWGLVGGLTTNVYKHEPQLSLHVGVSYLLPWHVTENTSLFVGYTSRKTVIAGFRVKL